MDTKNSIGLLYNFFHYIDPETKDSAWAAKMIEDLYLYGGAKCMMEGKDPATIRRYATGQQSTNKYKKMFKKMAKQIAAIEAQQIQNTGAVSDINVQDISGIDWKPLGILAQPLNSAISVLHKMPMYVKCTAIDALAQEKKKTDYDFLHNRPVLDADLADLSGKLKMPISSPTAKNNAENVDISNFDLDPSKPDELNFFFQMFHKLRPESAFESALMALSYALELKKVRDLESRDQFYYGRSCHRTYFSDITGLPKCDYTYPGNVYLPDSDLLDYNDVPFIYVLQHMSAEDLMNAFGNEISEKEVIALFNTYYVSKGWKQKWEDMDLADRKKSRLPVTYFEFKSWDRIDVHKKKVGRGYNISELVPYGFELRYSKGHPNPDLKGKAKMPSEDEYIERKWKQNTYTGYWVPTTPDGKVYKYKRLEGSLREAGREALSPFSIHPYKSQEKGAAELCMTLVDDAQRAYFKMQHTIIMSKPRGAYFDLRFMRQAVTNLATTDYKMGMMDLMTLLTDNNIFLGDSEGIDPNELLGGVRPYYEIPGGVGKEIEGFILVINEAIGKIAKITGFDVLANQAPNPDGLVGLQKLLLQSSINNIYYAQDAMKIQTERVYKNWASQVQYILKHRGTASYKAIEAIVGAYKVAVLEDLYTIPAHMWGIMVENVPTEAEQARLNQMLEQMFINQRITASDYVTLNRVFNYKDAQQLLAIREKKTKDQNDLIRNQGYQVELSKENMRSQTKLQGLQIPAEAGIKEQLIIAETQKAIEQMKEAFGIQLAALMDQIKTSQQENRQQHQIEKVRQMALNKAQESL